VTQNPQRLRRENHKPGHNRALFTIALINSQEYHPIVRRSVLILALGLAAFSGFKMYSRARPQSHSMVTFAHPTTLSASRTAGNSKFDTDVKPILEAQCKPCHFPGGAQYQHLPFDRPETIKKLGEKLFTRIKDEKDRRVIREFLGAP
jgi:hypothetical protein